MIAQLVYLNSALSIAQQQPNPPQPHPMFEHPYLFFLTIFLLAAFCGLMAGRAMYGVVVDRLRKRLDLANALLHGTGSVEDTLNHSRHERVD